MVSPTQGQVAHALLTRPPLGIAAPFDLNVLCTPPAFILSQDQTLDNLFILRLSAVDTFYRALFRSLTLLSSLRSLRSNLFLRISGSHKFFRRTASRQRVVFPFCFCCSFFNVPVRRPRSPADSLNILPHAPHFVNTFFQLFSLFFRRVSTAS